jgi:hypothetical protein
MFISIAIGLAVFFLLIRGLLDNRAAWARNATATARDLAKRVDLEESLYRPLLKLLAAILIAIATVANALTDFDPTLERHAEEHAVIGRFSAGLLFVGVGILLALLYAFLTNPFL